MKFRRLVTLFLVLWFAMSSLVLAVHAVARQQSDPAQVAPMLPSKDCAPPCWNGIEAEYTRGDKAITVMASLPNVTKGVKDNTWQFSPDGIHYHQVSVNMYLDQIALYPQGVRLGDLTMKMGKPDVVWLVSYRTDSKVLMNLYYADYEANVMVWANPHYHLSPDLPIYAILLATNITAPRQIQQDSWCQTIAVFLCG